MRILASLVALLTLAVVAGAGTSVVFAQAMGPGPYQGPAGMPQPGMPPMGPGPCYGQPGQCGGQEGCAGQGEAESDGGGGLFGRFCGSCDCPRWTFSGDLLNLERTNTRNQTLFSTPVIGAAAFTTEALNAQDFDFSLPLAFQLSAIRHCIFGSDFDLEVGYFQVDGWTANAGIPGISLATFDVNGPTVAMTDATARYVSSLYMGEINVRRQWADWLNLFVGFRMGELDEQYRANDAVTSFSLRTFNHLYGFQVGGDATLYDEGGPLSVHALCKAGIYGNLAAQRADVFAPVAVGVSANTTQTAFMGETGMLVKYQLTCHLALRLTAEATWLEGVALAPEQISNTDLTGMTPTSVDSHGGIFYYGGGFGIECQF